MQNEEVDGLAKLCSSEVRQAANVAITNPYIFATTTSADACLNGWNAIHDMATEAKCEHVDKITAIKLKAPSQYPICKNVHPRFYKKPVLWEEEPQTAHLMSITWASHIAASVLTGH